MSSPGSSNVEEDDEEEVIRRFLEESSELSPIKNGRGKKKIKWDLIAESLESPTKEDNSNFLSEGVIESNFVNSMVRPESQKVIKSSPSSSLNSSKRIQDTHPGLNVFSKEPFQYFSSKDLDLERDFGYKGRAAYEGALGPFDELKKDHLEFALLLCPESKSLLISNESDFKAIADYLFYSMSVVDSEDDFNVLSNSLVALCINYKFKWNIDYKKILTVYLNLGCNPSLIHNDGAIRRMIKSRLEVAARIRALRKKEVSTQGFSLSKSSILPPFALQRVSSIDKKYFRPVSRASDEEESRTAQKYNCLRRITKFLSVFSHQHKDRLSLMEPYDDWTGLLVVAYVMALMATDHRLIQLYPGCSFDIQQMLNSFLERFSHRQWSASMGSEISALCDVSKIFLYLGFTASPTLRTWDTPHGSEESLQKRDDNLDHHHNIVFRLSYLIPPTPRGRDLLKASAFLTLQFLLNREGEIVFEAPVSVLHVEELLLKDESLKKRFTGLFSSELYLAWSLLRTIDLIVGNDPVLDFSKELIPSVNQLSSFLRGCIRGLKDDFFDRNPSCLKEVVNQLLCKWNVLSLSSSKAYNTKITDFTVNKKK